MYKLALSVAAAAMTLTIGSTAVAEVVAGPAVGSYGTFTDTNTGKNWLRLDTFFNQSSADMISAASAAGFTFADKADVQTLLGSLPLGDGEWSTYSPVMGSAPNRDLIWASYGPLSTETLYGWAFAYSSDGVWSIEDDAIGPDTVLNGGTDGADMNIWAYLGGSSGAVPEPASWMLMIAGFGLVGTAARRRRTPATSIA